jgi:hypothetical protein
MKNTVKLFGIIALVAVIGFTLAACGEQTKDMEYSDATTTGRLTITGLSAYNGRGIGAWANTGSLSLYACERAQNGYNPNENNSEKYETFPATITNGQAVLKVFVDRGNSISGKNGGWGNYTGNDQNVEFSVLVDVDASGNGNAVGTVTVNFSNGIGSGVFTLPNP